MKKLTMNDIMIFALTGLLLFSLFLPSVKFSQISQNYDYTSSIAYPSNAHTFSVIDLIFGLGYARTFNLAELRIMVFIAALLPVVALTGFNIFVKDSKIRKTLNIALAAMGMLFMIIFYMGISMLFMAQQNASVQPGFFVSIFLYVLLMAVCILDALNIDLVYRLRRAGRIPCPRCSWSVRFGARFCDQCGVLIESAETAAGTGAVPQDGDVFAPPPPDGAAPVPKVMPHRISPQQDETAANPDISIFAPPVKCECGNRIEADFAFCKKCGKSLNSISY